MTHQVLKIFISSTAADLQDYRREVLDAVMRLDQLPVDMKFFGARPEMPLEECRALVASSDAVVVIAAHRYGWVPSKAEGGDGERSITWYEVDAARAAGRPLFVFLVDPGYPWPAAKEQDQLVAARTPDEINDVARAVHGLQRFKQLLGKEVVLDTFSTPDDLCAKVTSALARWLLNTGALGHISPAYGLSVLEIAQEHRYLNDGGDFQLTFRYRVLNTSEVGVSLLLPDSTSFMVADPRGLESVTTVDCTVVAASTGPASIAAEQVSFSSTRTRKIDGVDRMLTCISWRPKLTPSLPPGASLTYTSTIATKGTEQPAFSAAGSFAGIATPYPVPRLVFTCHAPPGYWIDRAYFKTYVRDEDGGSPRIPGLPDAVVHNDKRTMTWTLENDVVHILINYLLQFRFIPAAAETPA